MHWEPPELVPASLDGYVLEGRQGSQSWEVLDGAVASTDVQLLVPGLIKVGVGRGQTGLDGFRLPLHPSFPRAASVGTGQRLGWQAWP